jgi:hypothetical protein
MKRSRMLVSRNSMWPRAAVEVRGHGLRADDDGIAWTHRVRMTRGRGGGSIICDARWRPPCTARWGESMTGTVTWAVITCWLAMYLDCRVRGAPHYHHHHHRRQQQQQQHQHAHCMRQLLFTCSHYGERPHDHVTWKQANRSRGIETQAPSSIKILITRSK